MNRQFERHYDDWRKKRIDKIISLFGYDYFKGKTLLEIGCGYADIGSHFHKIGAKVTSTDGRKEHIDEVKIRHPELESFVLDVDCEWDLNRKFDIIIHFGVLYHLSNWKENLKATLNHSNLVIFETEVANSDDIDGFYAHREAGYDQSLHNYGVRPSAKYIESVLTELGASYTRYDDGDLNSGFHKYNWSVDATKPLFTVGQRRFWIITQ